MGTCANVPPWLFTLAPAFLVGDLVASMSNGRIDRFFPALILTPFFWMAVYFVYVLMGWSMESPSLLKVVLGFPGGFGGAHDTVVSGLITSLPPSIVGCGAFRLLGGPRSRLPVPKDAASFRT